MNRSCTFGIDADTFGALSPSGTRSKDRIKTVSGEPPLVLRHAKHQRPVSFSIQAGAEALGTRTINMLDLDTWTDFDKQPDGSYRSNTKINATHLWELSLPAGTYTLDYDINAPVGCNARIQFMLTDGSTKGPTVSSSGAYKHSTFSFTCSLPIEYVYVTYSKACDDVSIKNAMLVSGAYTAETLPPYEPYGCKIPVSCLSSGGEELDFSVFMKTMLPSHETLIVDPSGMPPLFKGTNTIDLNTDQKPVWIETAYLI